MPIREIAEQQTSDGRLRRGEAPGPIFRADDIRCSLMSLGRRAASSSVVSTSAPVCDRLRLMFDEVTQEPVPDLLTRLAEQLDTALASGELTCRKRKTPKS